MSDATADALAGDVALDALMNWPDAERYAIATALRTALALDRPWPTMAMPATPSSGAPPYSE